jgi:hypothetical protein
MKEMHCGHFQVRQHFNTRYDEKNAHTQCYTCNVIKSGEQEKHGKEIDRRYGVGSSDSLISKSRLWVKFSILDINEITETHKLKFKELQ